MVGSGNLHQVKDYKLIDIQDPHPEEVGEEEQEGGGAPDDLSRLRLIDWTRVQAAVEKTNQANHDLGKNCLNIFSFIMHCDRS